MSAKDWNNSALVSAWLSKSKENGDIYRQFLVNPIIYGLISGGWRTTPSPIYSALAKWLKTYAESAESEHTRGHWYAEWQRNAGDNLSILDLGCGEAYRGRWLSKHDVAYVGVDVSAGLLKNAFSKNKFKCLQKDLDKDQPLKGVWTERLAPDWVFAVTVLDHLAHPERLLADLASHYGAGQRGKMLVVTCNPSFYGTAGNGDQPARVRIATIGENGGEVTAYLRSKLQMRRLFRDAGFHIIDEASPHLPARLAHLRDFDASRFNLAHAPLNFWFLEIHSSQRDPVSANELKNWIAELNEIQIDSDSTRVLLKELIPHSQELAWRKLRAGDVVLGAHNIGGRIFVVKEGVFELKDGRVGASPEGQSTSRSHWRFNPGEMFGELELSKDDEERQWLYSASVFARSDGLHGHACVLEIPSQVTQRLIATGQHLGNPFLTLLRNKVLESLLKFDDGVLDDKVRVNKQIKKIFDTHNPSVDLYKLEARLVAMVASVVAQGLETERKQRTLGAEGSHIVLIVGMRDAIAEMMGENDRMKIDPNRFNLAIRFLVGTGVLRRARPVVSESAKGADQTEIERRKAASKRLRTSLEKSEWIRDLTDERKLAYRRLMALQLDCFFLVDDEIALRRCVLEPSYVLFERLAARRQLLLQQPCDVQRAMDDDLEREIIEFLKRRFEGRQWKFDSIGRPIVDEA